MYLSLNSLKSLIAQFLTFFCDSIHCLHAGFNVVGDVTVEQPFTRVLRTHLYCLKRRKNRHVIYCQDNILFMLQSTDKLSCCSCMLMKQNFLNLPDFNRFFFFIYLLSKKMASYFHRACQFCKLPSVCLSWKVLEQFFTENQFVLLFQLFADLFWPSLRKHLVNNEDLTFRSLKLHKVVSVYLIAKCSTFNVAQDKWSLLRRAQNAWRFYLEGGWKQLIRISAMRTSTQLKRKKSWYLCVLEYVGIICDRLIRLFLIYSPYIPHYVHASARCVCPHHCPLPSGTSTPYHPPPCSNHSHFHTSIH